MILAVVIFAAIFLPPYANAGNDRLSTELIVREHNSVSNQLDAKLTWLELSKNGNKLWITAEGYGIDPVLGTPEELTLAMKKKHVTKNLDRHLAAIEKFKKWRNIALERGDLITKKIDSVPVGSVSQVEYSMHSGNKTNHVLKLAFCSVGRCLYETSLTLPIDMINIYGQILRDFVAGNLKPVDDNLYQ